MVSLKLLFGLLLFQCYSLIKPQGDLEACTYRTQLRIMREPCQGSFCTSYQHFLPVGAIVIEHKPPLVYEDLDTWRHVKLPDELFQSLVPWQIITLVSNSFIQITYKTSAAATILRVYIGTTAKHASIQPSNLKKQAQVVRECWEVLFKSISRSSHHWDGHQGHEQEPWSFSYDSRSLSDIFTDITPPSPEKGFLDIVTKAGEYLKYPLYKFQRETIAKLLERESVKMPFVDPTYVPIESVDVKSAHDKFWIRPSTMEVTTEPPMFLSAEAGGILSEEMGAGKTLIILALILSTRGQFAKPSSETQNSETQTILSMRRFQSSSSRELRERFGLPEVDTVPSMVEFLLHSLASQTTPIKPQRRVESAFLSSALAPTLERLSPFYFQQGIVEDNGRRSETQPVRQLFLSRATLVIVPSSLYEQWKGEIYKFFWDGTLDVLFMNDTDGNLPSAVNLAKYDLVLATMEWLSASNRHSSTSAGPVNICQCLGDANFPDVPICSCPGQMGTNPIFQCRWRRLIVDEGHNTAYVTTEYFTAASKLSVENKWIITGTPTQHLIGALNNTRAKAPNVDVDYRGWTEEDEKDIRRLNNMIGRYLRMEPFFSQRSYFDTHVSTPLRKGWSGSRTVLAQIMQTIMIRHPIEEVEAEVGLQQLTHEHVLLPLERFQQQTYNIIQSTIITNAIDSERTDEDYMFHPRNAKALQDTLSNLSQALFWHADAEFFDKELEGHLHNSTTSIERAEERGRISQEDMQLLLEANYIQHEAVEDSSWRTTMGREDIPYLTTGIGDVVQSRFSRYTLGVPLYHPDRLLKLRGIVRENVNVDTEGILAEGEKLLQEEAVREMLVQLQKEKINKNPKANGRVRSPKKNPEAGLLKARTVVKDRGDSVLFDARVLSSGSSKINFIIQEVLRHSTEEKILIFSASLLSLLHLAEALQLANIPYLEYTSECSPTQRRVNISYFNNIALYRVFLMELKHGARGLNLVVASRVLFAEPVWSPDVEAQAIKRVHRTGQQKRVVVKTLAIRDTFEQEMLERRAAIQERSTKMPEVTDEAGLRSYIEHPRFLKDFGSGIEWSLPLIPLRSTPHNEPKLDASVDRMDIDFATNDHNENKRQRFEDDTDQTRKRLRFAE